LTDKEMYMNRLTNSESAPAHRFPPGFLWGASTSAYQIEGAVGEDDRSLSIWDVFSHIPGNVYGGDTGDVACDSYHRLDEDLELLSELGVSAYRFSIAWSRVLPGGTGAVNERGLDYYRRLVDELRARDIVPVATAYHWELPQVLEDRGGWAIRDTAKHLAEYAAVLAAALGDQVGMWITINEPRQSVHQGYRVGTHAPGRRDEQLAAAATHHILLGHGLALAALRATLPASTPVGISIDMNAIRAAGDGAEDAAAALDTELNRLYLDPVIHGRYPAEARASMLPPPELVRDGDMELIGAPVDFLGVNYYTPLYVRPGSWSDLGRGESPLPGHPGIVSYRPPDLPRTVMDWLIEPDGLYDVLMRLRAETGGLPLYVTENGCAADDYVNPEGLINDFERVAYLHGHLEAAWRAIRDGANLAGYFHWSLMDNFEWALGYRRRFGLYYVDFGTQRRMPKRSAAYYAVVARSGALPAAQDDIAAPHTEAGVMPASRPLAAMRAVQAVSPPASHRPPAADATPA
jgi:beta-glucosidase